MSENYSVDLCKDLQKRFHDADLHRAFRVDRYDAGDTVEFDVTAVGDGEDDPTSRVRLRIESFVGGGFAGQVYRTTVLDIEGPPVPGLTEGGLYAVKILIPPSAFACLFRNLLYAIGFQAPFQLQCNPAAARSGALWQKLIRRGAGIRFGSERVVNDVHATFVDPVLGSCGEISDWIDGRTWRLEVDDRMDLLRRWSRGKRVDPAQLGSPEFRAKKRFMTEFVELLHEMGGHEFARQYEWSTWKSQPNCLKRTSTEGDPEAGLVAVDFRAGLALLPFLPMSPGDFRLILSGLARGSVVQFDRGDLEKLEAFVSAHETEFADLREALTELRAAEDIYRNSIPDLTHNHVKLLFSRKLWSTMLSSAVTGWSVRNIIDAEREKRLRRSVPSTLLFSLLGIVPFLGPFLRRLIGRADMRRHYGKMLSSFSYFRRSLRGKAAESAISWHRAGRLEESVARRVVGSAPRFLLHSSLSMLAPGLHKFLTSGKYFRERLHYLFVRPVRLYFDTALREQWLLDMVADGQRKRLVTEEDAKVILSKIKEPFIQKYLKSLAVHVCTVPITQVVSVLVAVFYVLAHPELPRAQAWGIGVGIVALFQVIPISPGSLARGLYVVYLVIRERNFRDYNIAVFLGFFKYVGYLAFPIQMTYRYPELARFMAAHWATGAVHVMPVFGESGALMEHKVFCLFYNSPLTLRRRMRLRAEIRSKLRPRAWHVPVCALVAGGVLAAIDAALLRSTGVAPTLREMAWALVAVNLLGGAIVTLAARGASVGRRVISAALFGAGAAGLYTAITVFLAPAGASVADVLASLVWRFFLGSLLAPVGAMLVELMSPEPKAPVPVNEDEGTIAARPRGRVQERPRKAVPELKDS